MSQPLRIEIIDETDESVPTGPMTKALDALCLRADELELPGGTINLTFVNDEEIRALNVEFSGNDYATDVLSFNYLETGEAIDGVIGEIAISTETAAAQAAAAGTSLSDELALLAVHGVLHIGGYDHQSPDEQERMQELQRSILDSVGVSYREFKWQD